jgi:hypothetical protein
LHLLGRYSTIWATHLVGLNALLTQHMVSYNGPTHPGLGLSFHDFIMFF